MPWNPKPNPSLKIERAETFVRNTGADIRHRGKGAYYRLVGDYVNIHRIERYESPLAYYIELFHEIAHWSGAPHRLARISMEDRSDESYAHEEIVAAFVSYYVCDYLRIPGLSITQMDAYIDRWEAMLRGRRTVVTAGVAAKKAVAYLKGLQKKPKG